MADDIESPELRGAAEEDSNESPTGLARRLSLPMLILYGMGTTIGAGIYALTGAVAGIAGLWAPVAFVLAAVLAGFSALSLAELSARFPKAAGEAVYVFEGFRLRKLATLVGLSLAETKTTQSQSPQRNESKIKPEVG